MTKPRVPLIAVTDPIPEPATTKTFPPKWPTVTPEDVRKAGTTEESAALVTHHISVQSNARLKHSLPTVQCHESDRDQVWAENKKLTSTVMQKLWPAKTGSGGKKRLKTLFSGQFADVPLEEFLAFAADAGFEGVELACWHFNVQRALIDDEYVAWIKALFAKYKLSLVAISSHLVGQGVLDIIDKRHKAILPEYVWGDGNPHGVNLRCALEIMDTVAVAKRLSVSVINGFMGSSIWQYVYDFPPAGDLIQEGHDLLAQRWNPILDVFGDEEVFFALEVHPTEIAFDIYTAEKALQILDYRCEFGFNFDPSHLIWQGINPVEFIECFPDRIYHVHMKDAGIRTGGKRSVLGSNLPFGDGRRGFDFFSLGRGQVNFTEIIRALNAIGYNGPLSNEWEDSGMDRTEGAREASVFISEVDFGKSDRRMDEAFGS